MAPTPSALTSTLRNALYDHSRGKRFLPPAAVLLALFTSSEDEVAVGGYARRPVVMGAPHDGRGTNAEPVTVGPLDAGGTVTHVALFDDRGQQLTAVHPLDIAVRWEDNDAVVFDPGFIVLEIG